MLIARTERDLDRVADDVKKISLNTQVLKVVTDVTSKSSVENLLNEAFSKFNEIDVPSWS